MRKTSLALAGATVLLLACGTPQVAMDQANNGVRLTQDLQGELARYARNAGISAERRLKSIEAQDVATAALARNNEYETYLFSQAGKDTELAAQKRIRDASETYARLLQAEAQARADAAAQLPGTVQDLPAPAGKLSAVQKALADLGTELSARERLAVVTRFLKDAKEIADKNKQEAEGTAPAPAATASAPTVAASAAAGTNP